MRWTPGLTEIRYVEGHYALWDELRARHSGLWIDNCASGGRRIDLETLMRSSPCGAATPAAHPATPIGIKHRRWVWRLTCRCSLRALGNQAYVLRSAATGGSITQFDYLNDRFSLDEARAALAEVKENQKYWYGDFYPLTRAAVGPEAFIAWQLHRADLDAGIVLAFVAPNARSRSGDTTPRPEAGRQLRR